MINDYGIRIDYRTYDRADWRPGGASSSGVAARKGLWEVHYDPYDVSRVCVRNPTAGWITAPWTHLGRGGPAVRRLHLAARPAGSPPAVVLMTPTRWPSR